jgi:hypothetical protein
VRLWVSVTGWLVVSGLKDGVDVMDDAVLFVCDFWLNEALRDCLLTLRPETRGMGLNVNKWIIIIYS